MNKMMFERWIKMKVLFLGSDRSGSLKALDYLNENMDVIGCVGKSSKSANRLEEFCRNSCIPCYTNKELYENIENGIINENEVDLIVSYLFPNIIRDSLLNFDNVIAINFHPAPLPEHKGVAGCCFCVLDEKQYWGVSCHFLDKGLDTGDLIKVNRFNIDSKEFTGKSMELYLQGKLLELFDEVMSIIQSGNDLPRYKQAEGAYYSKEKLNSLKKINLDDSSNNISRKVNALWFPPYMGAYIEVDGKSYTLVDEKILDEIAELYRKIDDYGL